MKPSAIHFDIHALLRRQRGLRANIHANLVSLLSMNVSGAISVQADGGAIDEPREKFCFILRCGRVCSCLSSERKAPEHILCFSISYIRATIGHESLVLSTPDNFLGAPFVFDKYVMTRIVILPLTTILRRRVKCFHTITRATTHDKGFLLKQFIARTLSASKNIRSCRRYDWVRTKGIYDRVPVEAPPHLIYNFVIDKY